ncbi:MAG: MFS transporter, partial [Patescibacteria group bacterium]
RTSGIGIAANYLGQFAGLLLVLPFSNGSWNLFGAEPRAETLLPAVIMFAILTLPMLIYFHEPKKIKPELKIGDEIKNLVSQTKSLLFYPGIALFMLSYFFFNDAVLTAANNFPIFMEQVWGVSDTVKTYILIGILLTSAVGGLTAGLVADKVGHKKTLLFLVGGWLFILPFIAFIENFTLFVIATTVMGLWFGANWAVSRSVMSYLAPPQGHNLAFAYFGLVERASSFVGPIVWGLIVSGFVSIGSDRYRFATLAVTAFIVFGFISLWKVRSDRSYL